MNKINWGTLSLRELELIALALEFASNNRQEMELESSVDVSFRELYSVATKFEEYLPEDLTRVGAPDKQEDN